MRKNIINVFSIDIDEFEIDIKFSDQRYFEQVVPGNSDVCLYVDENYNIHGGKFYVYENSIFD